MGRNQRDAFIRAHQDGNDLPTDRFEHADVGGKTLCVMCGRAGYGPIKAVTTPGFNGRPWPWYAQYKPWQIDCLQDHNWPCSCGRRYRRFVDLWRHIGAERPRGWGRQGHHEFALSEPIKEVA